MAAVPAPQTPAVRATLEGAASAAGRPGAGRGRRPRGSSRAPNDQQATVGCTLMPMSGSALIGEDGLMPGFSGLVVDAPAGQRWELALTLIESGEAPVKVVELVISRNVAGPRADGVL